MIGTSMQENTPENLWPLKHREANKVF